MRRTGCLALVLVLGVLGVLLSVAGAAHAAPLQPQPRTICQLGEFQQHDMAGWYEEPAMLLIMEPCGVNIIAWINPYGEHVAAYESWQRVPGGGVRAYGFMPDPNINAYMDSVIDIAIKPAEPGWVQVATIDERDFIKRIYRLRKTQ